MDASAGERVKAHAIPMKMDIDIMELHSHREKPNNTAKKVSQKTNSSTAAAEVDPWALPEIDQNNGKPWKGTFRAKFYVDYISYV